MKDPAKYMLATRANCEAHGAGPTMTTVKTRQYQGHYCSMLAAATTRQHAGAWQACHNISQHNATAWRLCLPLHGDYVCHCMALMQAVAVTKTRSMGMIGIATTIHAWTKGDRQACHC